MVLDNRAGSIITMVGINGAANGSASYRPHPQVSFQATDIEPSSFFGRLRSLYAGVVLKTQLDQLKKQGSYDAFKLEWHPVYDVRRLKGAMTRVGDPGKKVAHGTGGRHPSLALLGV